MRKTLVVAVVLGAAMAAWSGQDEPINDSCPMMKGKKVKPNITSQYNGKTVAFCCNKCKRAFDANPEKYASMYPGLNEPKKPVKARVGLDAPEIALSDFKLSGQKGKIVVLAWMHPDSKNCKRLVKDGRIAKMIEELKALDENVVFVPILTAASDKLDKLNELLSKNKLDASALDDKDGSTGKTYQVTHTPQVLVVDKDGKLAYSGAIDNDSRGKRKKFKNYAVTTVEALVNGRKVNPKTTRAYGEKIKYPK